VWGAEPETAAPAALLVRQRLGAGVPELEGHVRRRCGRKSVFPRMWQRMQPLVDGYIVVTLDQ